MADSVFELLVPHLDHSSSIPSVQDAATSQYLERLTSLSLEGLTQNEQESLEHNAQTINRSLQALAKRSYKSINTSIDSLEALRAITPTLPTTVVSIQSSLPELESSAVKFSEKYAQPLENPALERRRRALRLTENVDKLCDILELPTLLSSLIAASTNTTAITSMGVPSSTNANYASALDLYAHIKRLQKLYPDSALVMSIATQAEDAMRDMTTNLINSLRSNSLKLASAMRLIGLLRRVAPELDDAAATSHMVHASTQSEGSLGALFLICRLVNLTATLDALEPLRELADQEIEARKTESDTTNANAWAAGQQTERYLKRYIEIFREQCFAIVSMYKNIFPASLAGPTGSLSADAKPNPLASLPRTPGFQGHAEREPQLTEDSMQTIPPALTTFTMHLVETLTSTLKAYMPNIHDQSSRDSLLTQVLYCAGSLGRLGGDFGMTLALLEEELGQAVPLGDTQDTIDSPEWVQVMRKHRVQAGRLELLASGAGKDRFTSSREVTATSG